MAKAESIIKTEFIRRARLAQHNGQPVKPLVDEYCDVQQCTPQAAYRLLARAGAGSGRKQRDDRGKSKVPAEHIAATGALLARSKRNGPHKVPLSAASAVRGLVASGAITPASQSTYNRLLADRCMDAASLRKPTPYISLRSERPNSVWMIDASQAAQWYLKYLAGALTLVLDRERDMEDYKPDKREKRLSGGVLKRYIVVDHYSGAFMPYYAYAGGERQEDFMRCLWEAMRYKGDDYIMRGIPEMVYSDGGAGLTADAMQNVFAQLGIRYDHHKKHNPRAKGAVETMMRAWEQDFECLLLAQGITHFNLDELNGLAYSHALVWNRDRKIGRAGVSRFALYEKMLDASALRYPPEWDTMLELARSEWFTRTVRGDWGISFAHKRHDKTYRYSLRSLSRYDECQPGAEVKFRPSYLADDGSIEIVTADGAPHLVAPLNMGIDGKPVSAPLMGQEYKRNPDDMATTARKAALATPLPMGEDEQSRLVSIGVVQAEKRIAARRMVVRLVWIDAYEDCHDVTKAEAAQAFAELYGDADEGYEDQIYTRIQGDKNVDTGNTY